MENQVIISIPDQINESTPISITKDITINHRTTINGGDVLIPEVIEATIDDYLKFISINGEFDIDLNNTYFEPNGIKTIKTDESFLVRIKQIPKDGFDIPITCSICPKPPADAQKKIIVKNVGETDDVRLGNLLKKMKLLESIIQKRIHK